MHAKSNWVPFRVAMVMVLITFVPILAAFFLTRDGDRIAGGET